MTNKIIYFYQTFNGLDNIINSKTNRVTDIILSSIHFGYDSGNPYIHLNDYPPNHSIFDTVWDQLNTLRNYKNINIHLMVGGAGGAFHELFNNFDVFYKLLKNTILNHPIINGINLDIEEDVDLNDIIKLIQKIVDDFGPQFTISTAPVEIALIYDVPGFGGFLYKDLENSSVGKYIKYYLGQFYGDFCYNSFKETQTNNWPCEKIVIGMFSGEFDEKTFGMACNEVAKIKENYPNFGGVYNWEYFDSPPDKSNPYKWAELMYKAMHN